LTASIRADTRLRDAMGSGVLARESARADALIMRIAQKVVRTALPFVLLAATTTGCGPSVADDADRPSGPGTIVFMALPSTEESTPQLFSISGDGTGLRQLTSDETLKTSMAWSPDGSHIAYTALEFDPERGQFDPERQRDESNLTSIYSVAMDGSNERRLCAACSKTVYSQVPGPGMIIDDAGAADYAVPDSLAWSPDGSRLVAPAASNGLLVVNTADGTTRVIDTDESVTAVAWSPDGRTVAASHTWFLSPNNALGEMAPPSGTWWWENRNDRERPGGIYLIDVDSGTVEEVVSTEGIAHVHGWSSDGRLLAYTRIGGGGKHAELAAYSIEERRSWPLVPAERGSADQGAGWAPGGDHAAALIDQFDQENHPVLWVASSSGDELSDVEACGFEGAVQGDCIVPGIAWSPNGDEVAYRAAIQHTPLIHVLVMQDIGSDSHRVIEIPELFPDYTSGYCCIAWHA
jgi:Tol biopolymer transport system component